MAKQTIGIGSNPNDKTGDTLRSAFDKVNDNFTEVYQADSDEITNRTAADAALQTQIDDLEASQNAGAIGFDTKSNMDGDLDHDAGTIAQVMNDSTASYNGYYRKTGASGSGSWVKRADFYATDPDVDNDETTTIAASPKWTKEYLSDENFIKTVEESEIQHIDYAELNENNEIVTVITNTGKRLVFGTTADNVKLEETEFFDSKTVTGYDYLVFNEDDEIIFAVHETKGVTIPRAQNIEEQVSPSYDPELQSENSLSNGSWNAFSNYPSLVKLNSRVYSSVVGDASQGNTAPLFVGIKNRRSPITRIHVGNLRGDTGLIDNHNNPTILKDDRDGCDYPIILFQAEHNTHKLRMRRFTNLDLTEGERWVEIGDSDISYTTVFRYNNEILLFARKQKVAPRPWIIYYSSDNGDSWLFKDFATSDQNLFYLTVREKSDGSGLNVITWNHPNYGDQGFGYISIDWSSGQITTLGGTEIYADFRNIFDDVAWNPITHLVDNEDIYVPASGTISSTPSDVKDSGGKLRVIFEEYAKNPTMADFNLSEYKVVQTDIATNVQEGIYTINEGGMTYRNLNQTTNANLAGCYLVNFNLAVVSVYKNDSQLAAGSDVNVQEGLSEIKLIYLSDPQNPVKTTALKKRRKLILPMSESTQETIAIIDCEIFNTYLDYSSDLILITTSDYNYKGF